MTTQIGMIPKASWDNNTNYLTNMYSQIKDEVQTNRSIG